MKVFNILTAIFLLFQMVAHAQNTDFEAYGASFNANTTSDHKNGVFEKIGVKDTIATQISGTIVEVCKSKGCWMKVDTGNKEQVFVKFKDYGFFVPTDSENGKVVMNGVAFVEEVSVDEQRHYAEDAGKSKEEVAKITKPKRTLRFEASGVQIEK
ncbi:DUF4920 domain-containing protein [Flagellimonas sp. HMM57]|uniref:DUF4920 domain-containing protein n=1 Tax=unclassified Flagellimonas TaxID=2644544 RepID=UPI0013D05F31|nr:MULTISPECIES: DUF4920 domain-containing protein [unclassified Flagellimonas]UII75116.1 DUF4920 domain-containing protein [Flagellimonas sp. HMM57]